MEGFCTSYSIDHSLSLFTVQTDMRKRTFLDNFDRAWQREYRIIPQP